MGANGVWNERMVRQEGEEITPAGDDAVRDRGLPSSRPIRRVDGRLVRAGAAFVCAVITAVAVDALAGAMDGGGGPLTRHMGIHLFLMNLVAPVMAVALGPGLAGRRSGVRTGAKRPCAAARPRRPGPSPRISRRS